MARKPSQPPTCAATPANTEKLENSKPQPEAKHEPAAVTGGARTVSRMSPLDLARWRGQQHRANQLRREDLQPPLLRLVELSYGEAPRVVDEIVSVHPAEFGWFVVEVEYAEDDNPFGEPVLAWAVGREGVWPITVAHNAEHWARETGWGLLAPDGRVYANALIYQSVAEWLSMERPELNASTDGGEQKTAGEQLNKPKT